eukprot:1158648-Pelagomonas_calceolata.AAC.9
MHLGSAEFESLSSLLPCGAGTKYAVSKAQSKQKRLRTHAPPACVPWQGARGSEGEDGFSAQGEGAG